MIATVLHHFRRDRLVPHASATARQLVFAIAVGFLPAVAAADTTPRHVRALWKTDPATSATISWTTSAEGEQHAVRIRAEDAQDWTTIDCQRSEQYNGRLKAEDPPYLHHTRLVELRPATKYHVVCESDGERSEEYYFITAPDEDRPVALLFGGDSRSGIDARQDINRMMARMVAEQSAAGRPAILALAHGGDFIVDGKRLDQWLQWLGDHELTTGSDGRLLPIIPTRGNHDGGPLFDQVFDFVHGDGNYFACSLTPQVRLATLNTEISTAGDQREWLENELAAERWNHRWYLCQYHKPAFPAVKVPSGALPNWVPLFDEYRIDLACESDGHVIKRTPPIRNAKVDPEGIIYIGEGGLGVGQRTPKTHRWYLQDTADKCGAAHHLHLLTFTAEALNCKVIKLGGEVFDEFTLEPRQAPRKTASVD